MIWPMLLAIVVWTAAAMFFWDDWVAGMTGMVQATPLEQWIAHGFLAVASHYLIVIVLLLLLLPAIYLTALLITSVFAMTMMVDHVAERYYPELERKQGGSNAGSIANAAAAIVVYCAGWVLSLPLWLFTPLAMVLPLLLMAWLNQHLFRYDALAEHASREEYALVVGRSRGRLFLLGAAVGLLQFVPLLNMFSPVYVALAFIHFCLAELKQLRRAI
jgi:CysZ protein